MDGTKLSNLAGITLPGNWDIPNEGSIGNVRNVDTNRVLGVTADGTEVTEDYLLHSGSPGQQWEIVGKNGKSVQKQQGKNNTIETL